MTVPCWFLLAAVALWALARVLLSPSGQGLLDALAQRVRGERKEGEG